MLLFSSPPPPSLCYLLSFLSSTFPLPSFLPLSVPPNLMAGIFFLSPSVFFPPSLPQARPSHLFSPCFLSVFLPHLFSSLSPSLPSSQLISLSNYFLFSFFLLYFLFHPYFFFNPSFLHPLFPPAISYIPSLFLFYLLIFYLH